MHPPKLTHVTTVIAQVSKPIELGITASGARRIIPITSGIAKGDLINGVIGGGFNDYQLIRSDSVAEIQARYVIETEDGALIYVENNGIRHGAPELVEKLKRGEYVDPSLIYFKASPKLESSDARYEWVNRHIFICEGARYPDRVELNFWRVD